MELEVALLTAMNKNTQELYHEVVPFEPAEAQRLSDKAVDILRAIAAEELPRRIAAAPDFYLCRMCPYARRCWEGDARARASRPPTGRRRRSARSRTGSCTGPRNNRSFVCLAMPVAERPLLTRHAIDELGLDTMVKSADGIVSDTGGVLYAAFTGKAALVMTRKGTPASTIHSLMYRVLGSNRGGDRAGRERDRRDQGQAADPRSAVAAVRGVAPPQPRDPPRRHPQAPLRPQRAVDRLRRSADRARRGLDGRRRDGARPARVRQADPGAGRPRPAAADQGRRRVHQSRARRHADRDPPPGRRERDHPPRHHGAAGRSRSATASTTLTSGRCARRTSRPSRCCVAAR